MRERPGMLFIEGKERRREVVCVDWRHGDIGGEVAAGAHLFLRGMGRLHRQSMGGGCGSRACRAWEERGCV